MNGKLKKWFLRSLPFIVPLGVLAVLAGIAQRHSTDNPSEFYERNQPSGTSVIADSLAADRCSNEEFVLDFVASSCAMMGEHTRPGHYRFFSFKASNRFGNETLPDQITGPFWSKTAYKSYLVRSVKTTEVDAQPNTWRTFLLVLFRTLYFPTVLIAVLLLFVGLGALTHYVMSGRQRSSADLRRGVITTFMVILITAGWVALGHAAGAKVVIDNATDRPFQIYLNGQLAGSLPPHTFLREQAGGGSLHLKVYQEGVLTEEAHLKLDASLIKLSVRALFGRGEVVYNIGAVNYYSKTGISYTQEVEIASPKGLQN